MSEPGNTHKKNKYLSVLLLGFFLFCFLTIAGIGLLFERISEELAQQLDNQRVRISVSEQIVTNILRLESLLFQMAPAANSTSYRRTISLIDAEITLLEHHLHVIQNGGQVKRLFSLNVPGIDQYESRSSYKPDANRVGPAVEIIELQPFVDRVRDKARDLLVLLESRDECVRLNKPCAKGKMAEVRSFYKELPPFFYRLNENANRQHFEGLARLDSLQQELKDKESKLRNLHIILILIVLIFGTVLTALFLRRVNAAQLQAEQAREKAEEASLAKTRFLATMSHEIRTPMNGILGMVQILEDEELSATQRRDNLRVIRNSGNTLMQLLNDILDLAKVEAGKMELRLVPVSPAKLVLETAALFTDMAHAKGIELTVSSEVDESFRSSLDADRVRQMIGNLINNAIKFTESGKVHLHLTRVVGDQGANLLEFSVEDTGMGIPVNKQDGLFKRFAQIDDSSTRRYDGSGLGLFIVRQFAQIMGGTVGFESAAGEGSRFWFRILDNEVTVDQLVLRNDAEIAGGEIKNTLAGHVLLAEDNPTNRVILKAMLTRMGLTSRMVEDGRMAFDAYTSSEAFDCILMDVSMPIMDGLEATLKIREWERKNGSARCPIIAITANAYSEDRKACLEAGMDDFVAKPILMAALHSCLARVVRKRTSGLPL